MISIKTSRPFHLWCFTAEAQSCFREKNLAVVQPYKLSQLKPHDDTGGIPHQDFPMYCLFKPSLDNPVRRDLNTMRTVLDTGDRKLEPRKQTAPHTNWENLTSWTGNKVSPEDFTLDTKQGHHLIWVSKRAFTRFRPFKYMFSATLTTCS